MTTSSSRFRNLQPAFWLLSANLTRYAGQLVLFASIAVYLGSGPAGKYALAQAITAPIFILFGLGLRTLILTLSPSTSLRNFTIARSLSLLVAIGVTVLVAVVFQSEFSLILLIVGLSKCVDSFADFYGGVSQRLNSEWIAASMSGAAALGVIGGTVLAWGLGLTLIPLILMSATGSAIGLFVAQTTLLRPRLVEWRAKRTRYSTSADPSVRMILRAGLPTGSSAVLAPLLVGVPQYTLALTGEPSLVAHFTVFMYMQLGTEMVTNSLSQAWTPRGRELELSRGLTRRDVFRVSLRWERAIIPTSALSLLAAALLFPTLFQDAYQPDMASYLLVAASSVSLPFVYAGLTSLPIRHLYRRSVLTNAIALSVSIILSAALIPSLGVVGALSVNLVGLLTRATVAFLVMNTPHTKREQS
ncbi:oligosaccharide flippase family protein [Leifsonia sp. YIM 134122]|uniref:Oligosaccharide flippase family protein n=1 Tax=Leifsonia stereocauli TaxID=3134136 RepID=A0ABU9W7K4_9MICO